MMIGRLRLALSTGFREIRSNKARSVLSFGAVAVGVASLLYTFAQVNGLSLETTKAVSLMGPGRMSVQVKEGYVSRGLSPGLTSDDAEEIARIPGLHMAYPKIAQWGVDVRFQGKRYSEMLRVMGTTPDWVRRDWVYTRRGRFLDWTDVREAARVCVIVEPGGWDVKPFWASFIPPFPWDAIVQHRDMLGREIQIGEHLFTVVGVLREPPRDKDPRWDREWGSLIIVPVTAFHLYVPSYGRLDPHTVDSIQVDSGSEGTIGPVRRAIQAILHRRHRGEEDFDIRDSREEIQGQMNEVRQYIIVGMALGSVAILAGGIGIMNVTLATIFLRIKEIGIRRALGASRVDIVAQFVAEATLLGFFGGVAGIGLGMAGIETIARQAERDLAQLAWPHFVAALAIAAATGFAFSVVPAWRASGLDPVEALRNE